MNSLQSALKLRAAALAQTIHLERDTIGALALETMLRSALEEATSDLRRDLEDATRAHDSEVARLRRELRETRDRVLQHQREAEACVRALERARGELEFTRDVAVSALHASIPASHHGESGPTRTPATVCNGSGSFFANVFEEGAFVRRLVQCSGCVHCARSRSSSEVRHG